VRAGLRRVEDFLVVGDKAEVYIELLRGVRLRPDRPIF
jgi:hypothetical protein